MTSIRLAFTRAAYEVAFESGVLLSRFSDAFRIRGNDQSSDLGARATYCISVTGLEDGAFAVHLDGRVIRGNMTMPEAAYCITQVIGDAFCSWVDETVCVMHAASVLHKGGVVLFSGVSGSGKTSLALEFSRYGKFAGDEYAFMDMGRATAWHEEFPFQLKASNRELLSRYGMDRALEVRGGPHGTAFYLPLDSVSFHPVKREDDAIVSAVVFPHFLPGSKETSIRRLSAGRLPEYVLASLIGAKPPSSLFVQFVHMSARYGLRFYEMEYSDLARAASELDKRLSKDGA
jgi:hypothetical protein